MALHDNSTFISPKTSFEKCIKLDLNKVGVGETYFPTPLQLKKCQWLPVKFRGQGPCLGLPWAPTRSTLVPWSKHIPYIHYSPPLT